MMVPLAEGRRLKVEKGVGSTKACGAMTLEEVHQIYVRLAQRMDPSAVESPSMEGRGVRSTEAKEPPSELCYIDLSSSVWYLSMCAKTMACYLWKVTTPFLFKLIPAVVRLGVLWFSPDIPIEIGFKGDILRADTTKRINLMVQGSHDS
ncbi:hypothetical protein RHSIM_Rhsim03G0233800 [Rhododendron simsii]|uniref:Uncharacterized protein n=1 Tax=Rhododendron simsii TaxID=118357 RepID=A0A834H4S0_RHOSS|nr:hypothetical protein RHSIM_Rhsim03G0233800 [Rhododendron simsii]